MCCLFWVSPMLSSTDLLAVPPLEVLRRFEMKFLPPRNPPHRETQISRYLAVQIPIWDCGLIWICTEEFEGLDLGDCRGVIFSTKKKSIICDKSYRRILAGACVCMWRMRHSCVGRVTFNKVSEVLTGACVRGCVILVGIATSFRRIQVRDTSYLILLAGACMWGCVILVWDVRIYVLRFYRFPRWFPTRSIMGWLREILWGGYG